MTTAASIPSVAPTPVKLDAQLKGRLKRLAKARHRAPHWLMREAIAQYVEREERRQSMREDALQAWQEYQVTGLHVTSEEADAWLAKLEAGEDVDPPVARV
jgi:predicted transcriptional regulator